MICNILPLRDVVIYPGIVTPLFVGRESSIKAIESASHTDMRLVLVTQKQPDMEEPTADDLYNIGTLVNITQMMKLPDGTVKLLVEGVDRVLIKKYLDDGLTKCQAEVISVVNSYSDEDLDSVKKTLLSVFEKYIKRQRKQPKEILDTILNTTNISKIIDIVASHLTIKTDKKVEVLLESDVEKRMILVLSLIEAELDVFDLDKAIKTRVKQQIDKNQKEYYLNEQSKAIQKELESLDGSKSEFDLIEKSIKKAKMPKKINKKCLADLSKLRKMPPMSSESTVLRNYLDTLISFPWSKETKAKVDIAEAKKILDESHYGLDKVKDMIVEYIAVQQRTNKNSGSILCLVGPPGVGKTSIGKAIAKSLGRKYIRMSLGGVRDEAEIRGHRRTYIGAIPGKIVQNVIKSKVNNPFFLLDEIDKMGSDHRGDPSSAMLEVLDPEQNNSFNDHYMEVDVDLSKVIFIATANSMNIPGPLLDRMDVIRIPGYTEEEKFVIAKNFLISNSMSDMSLKNSEMNITDGALKEMVEGYTRESGVRSLKREINKVCRKVVSELALDTSKTKISVSKNNLSDYLGVAKYKHDGRVAKDSVGVINGLAWTSVGGELLKIEVLITSGKGKIIQTGKLGDVMKESVATAMTVVKKYANDLGVSYKFFDEHDFHIHLPEAAVPKDGPSAGVALSTALISAVMNEKINSKIAMTGEVTLQGKVLAIGGLKEKLFAAVREKIEIVFIPKENEMDLIDISADIKDKLKIHLVSDIKGVFLEVFSSHLIVKKKTEVEGPYIEKYMQLNNEITQKH